MYTQNTNRCKRRASLSEVGETQLKNVGISNHSMSKSRPVTGSSQTCSLSFAYRVGVSFGSAAKTVTESTSNSKANAKQTLITLLLYRYSLWCIADQVRLSQHLGVKALGVHYELCN